MPTYSDDGQWWWDGRSWQPVSQQPPQQPYAGPPPQQQFPGQQPLYPQQGFYGQPEPPRKRRAVWIVVGAVVVGAVLLAIGVPAGILAWRATSGDDNDAGHGIGDSGTSEPKGKNLQPGQSVTAQSLAEVDPATFYESVVKRQMTAPIGRVKSSMFGDPQKFASRQLFPITDIAIDHTTDKFYYFQTILTGPTDDEPTNIACLGTKEMHWSNYSKKWEQSTFTSNTCTKKPFMGAGDGVFSSGLTVDQADQVLAKLRTYKGYVNVAKPILLSAGGTTYVRQVVDFKPITLADKNYWGSAISMWAFRDAGLDPVTWPWSNPFNLTEGIHMVYYLDTKTLLPVAAFQRASTPRPATASRRSSAPRSRWSTTPSRRPCRRWSSAGVRTRCR
ncbi:hypothetical protein [Kribbella capetownensis]|uniref:hypothetical protein n=1 Tax=Kribbella capetownensis TaxID=1572659 RepID=UPI0013F47F36|nr:hypothetical protein [Kribbella capetownensis]